MLRLAQRTFLRVVHVANTTPTRVRTLASFYDDRFYEDSKKIPPRVTFQDLVKFDPRSDRMDESQLVSSAQRVQESLPMRIARRISDMNNLPYGVMIHPLMQQVYNYYRTSYEKLIDFPAVDSLALEHEFSELLPEILAEGQDMLALLAKASREISSHMEREKLKEFLEVHLTSRISRRLLAEQHVAIHNQFYSGNKTDDHIGVLALKCDAERIARKTFQLAQRICRDHYGCAPAVEFNHPRTPSAFPYIPMFLEYIFIELFKNAVRATVENTPADRRQESLPKIQVSIYNQADEVTIRIADKAGGIPAHKMDDVWQYAYTTVDGDQPKDDDRADGIQALAGNRSMAGEGFGLPMARVYCRYFGGDLQMQSIFGHGTELFVRLKHLDPAHYNELVQTDA